MHCSQADRLHCSSRNLPRRSVQLEVRNFWLPSLLASLARVMGHQSPLLATAPQTFPRRVGSYLAHAAALACGFAMADSVQGSGAAAPGKCRRAPFGVSNQPGHDLLPLSFKGIFVGAPPAQHAFSPLLLSVQGLEPCCRIGDAPPNVKLALRTIVRGKDTDGGRSGG